MGSNPTPSASFLSESAAQASSGERAPARGEMARKAERMLEIVERPQGLVEAFRKVASPLPSTIPRMAEPAAEPQT